MDKIYNLPRDILISLAFFLLWISLGSGCSRLQKASVTSKVTTHQEAVTPQNVLLITIDTLRADHLGCYGYSKIHTPTIDALARQGVRFKWAFTPTPLTLPSHTTIMTGLYPCTHGVLNNGEYRLSKSTRTLAQILHSQGLNTAAFIGAFVLSKQFGLDQGFETYNDDLAPLGGNKVFYLCNERKGEKVTQACLQWLEKENPNRFFIWVHYFDPHTRYEPPQPFLDQYPEHPYDGEIAYTDHCLGLLLKKLAERGLLDKTLVVLVADHGESLGEHMETTHGIFLYDATIRVPLILRYPALLPAGRVYSQSVKTVDIMPTILDLLQIPHPPGLQGKNLLTSQPTKDIFLETRFPELNFGWSRLEGVRTRQWKYISAPRPELYDLSEDPAELHNVLDQYPKQAGKLKKELQNFLQTSVQKQNNRMEMDEATRKRLQQLGYVQMSRTAHNGASSATALGPDPKDGVKTLPLFDQGSEEYSSGQYDLATKSFRQVLQRDPGNIMARFLLASALEKLGRLEKSLKKFQEVSHRDTSFINVHNNLGTIYEKLGQYEQALIEYQTDIKLHPDSPLSYNNLGVIYLKRSQYAKAKEQFEKLLSLNPDLPTQVVAHANLAMACEMLGLYDQAQQEYQHSLRLDPKYLAAHMGLGNVYLKTQRLDQAIKAWQQALKINPQMAEAHFNLGCTFMKQKRLDQAIDHLQEALRLEPNLWQARMLLEKCRQRKNPALSF